MEILLVTIIVIIAMTYLVWRWFWKKRTPTIQGETNTCEGCSKSCDSTCQPPQ